MRSAIRFGQKVKYRATIDILQRPDEFANVTLMVEFSNEFISFLEQAIASGAAFPQANRRTLNNSSDLCTMNLEE